MRNMRFNMRNMRFNRRLLFAIAILCAFGLLVIGMLLSWIYVSNGIPVPPLMMFLFEYHLELMILVAALGIVVGASMFFLMQEQVQVKTKEAAGNARLLLSFLSRDERAVVELLLESEGHATQAAVSRLEGMTRLRAHRVVLRLSEKKIVRIEKIGKTNQLWLNKTIYEALAESEGAKRAEEEKKTPSRGLD